MKQERVGEAFKLPGGSFVLFSDLNYDFSHSNVFAKAVVFAHDCALTQDALHQLFYTYVLSSYCPARTTNQKPPAACGQVTLNQSVFSCSLRERYRVLKMRVKGFNLQRKNSDLGLFGVCSCRRPPETADGAKPFVAKFCGNTTNSYMRNQSGVKSVNVLKEQLLDCLGEKMFSFLVIIFFCMRVTAVDVLIV